MQRSPYVLVTPEGVCLEMQPGGGERYSFFEVFIRDDYFSQGQRLGAGDTVIDIGANIGCFTLQAASRVTNSGRVIAVEPERETYRRLSANVARNELPQVTLCRAAVSGRSGSATLHVAETSLFNSMFKDIDGKSLPDSVQQVPTLTLADLMEAHGIRRCHYLKVDCEGAEHEIFQTMDAQTAARIDQATIEVHRVDGGDPRAVMDRLRVLGFQVSGETVVFAHR